MVAEASPCAAMLYNNVAFFLPVCTNADVVFLFVWF